MLPYMTSISALSTIDFSVMCGTPRRRTRAEHLPYVSGFSTNARPLTFCLLAKAVGRVGEQVISGYRAAHVQGPRDASATRDV